MGYKKGKKLLLAFASLIFSFIIFFAAAEIYLRHTLYSITAVKKPQENIFKSIIETEPEELIMDTPLGRRLIPNARVTIRNHIGTKEDVLVETNSLGFRDDEIPEEKGKEYRILVLGDSITISDGLPAEDTFVKRMQFHLNGESLTGDYRVINAGLGSLGTSEEINLLEEKGVKAEPDLVILAFYLNDSRPEQGFAKETGSRGFIRSHSVFADAVYRYFILKNYLKYTGVDPFKWDEVFRKSKWYTRREDFIKLVEAADYDFGVAWQTDSWQIIDREFARLDEIAKREGFRVVVVGFPVVFQVVADFLEDTPQKLLEKYSGKYGFYYYDLLPKLRENKDIDMFYDHAHPNREGSRIIGNVIAEFLTSQVLPELK